MKVRYSILPLLILFYTIPSLCELANTTTNQREYKGGADEEDLQVQERLKTPQRTISLRLIQRAVYAQVLKEANVVNSDETPEN